jgi:peptide/nickel transport system substrate-binding protein
MSQEKKSSDKKKQVSRRDFMKWTTAVTAGIAAGGFVDALSPISAPAQSPAGAINVVLSADADSFDPYTALGGTSQILIEHIFEFLVTKNSEPSLATSWENPDKLTWIFHIKKGVEFTNGEPFDASVVRYSLERYMDPNTKAGYAALLKPVESIDILERFTVRVKTKEPYPILLHILSTVAMMSPKAVKELGKDIVRKPVGTGPFVLREWVPMERMVMEANPSYHGSKAKVKSVVWRPVAEPSSRIVELKTGKADIIDKVPPELADQVSGSGLKLVRIPSIFRMVVMLNCAKPPFDNAKVRQALNYAANKEDLIKYVLRGAGYPMGDPLGPGIEGYDPKTKPYPYDPARAKKLLAEAGYPQGVDFEILTPAGRYLKDKETMEALAFQVKESGFNMKVVAQEWGIFLKNFKSRDGFFIGTQTPNAHLFLSRNFDSRTNSYSWFGYHNTEFNKLIDEAQETFDPKKRSALYQKLSNMVFDDAVYLYLYFSMEFFGVNERVKNYAITNQSYLRLHNAYIS